MIFSVPEHIEWIRNGLGKTIGPIKTQTRRPNRGYYVVGKTYAIQPCRICKGIENYRIMMDKIWLEKGGISHEDALAEGEYTPAEFEWLFFKIYHGRSSSRWAYEFHVVRTAIK